MKITNEFQKILTNLQNYVDQVWIPAKSEFAIGSPTASDRVVQIILPEEIPHEFGTHDLRALNRAIGLVGNEPNLDIEDDGRTAVIYSDDHHIEYRFLLTPQHLLRFKTVDRNETTPFITFNIADKDWQLLRRSAAGTDLEKLYIDGGKNGVLASVRSSKVKSSNVIKVVLDETPTEKFSIVLTFPSIDLIKGDYKVDINKKGLVRFSLDLGNGYRTEHCFTVASKKRKL